MVRQQIFLSYIRQDRDKALVIATELKQFGVHCFDEIKEMPLGARMTQVLASNIRRSLAMIFLVSEESLRSQCVRGEIEFALQNEKQVIPILSSHSVLSSFQSSWFPEDLKSGNPLIYSSEGLRTLCAAVEKIVDSQGVSQSLYREKSRPGCLKKALISITIIAIVAVFAFIFLLHRDIQVIDEKSNYEESEARPELNGRIPRPVGSIAQDGEGSYSEETWEEDVIYAVDSAMAEDIPYEIEDTIAAEIPVPSETEQSSDTITVDTSAISPVTPDIEEPIDGFQAEETTQHDGIESYWWLILLIVGVTAYVVWLKRKIKTKFVADIDCKVYADNKEIATLQARKVAFVSLPRGNYYITYEPKDKRIEAKSKEFRIVKEGELISIDFPVKGPGKLKVIKCFIAGSTHLEDERNALRSAISMTNNEWKQQNIEVLAFTFEDFDRQMVEGGQQNQYNEFLKKEATVAAFIISGAMGDKTKEEFQIANDVFKAERHPEIIIFNSESTPKNKDTKELEKLIEDEKQYWVDYKDNKDLRLEFMFTLNRLIRKQYL